MEPRKQNLRPNWKNIQSREPWAHRAAVLYLRNVEIFNFLLRIGWHQMTQHGLTLAFELTGSMPYSNYRARLLRDACVSYQRGLLSEDTERAATYHSEGAA